MWIQLLGAANPPYVEGTGALVLGEGQDRRSLRDGESINLFVPYFLTNALWPTSATIEATSP